MDLRTTQPIVFVPTAQPDAARRFYEETLGLAFVQDDRFAMVFRLGPHATMMRLVRVGAFTPAPFTILGWEVEDIGAAVEELSARGIGFLRFEHFEQDSRGIWRAPDGSAVAWFHDPDGNTLSISQHA